MRFVLLFMAACGLAFAHVGSPDVYLDGQAGPYRLYITVRPPNVIPGVAEIEVRSETSGTEHIRAVPLPISGPGVKFAPTADELKRTTNDSQYFAGALWLMAPGSWQVRINVDGNRGPAVLSVPIPAVALRTASMDWPLGFLLFCLMIALTLAFVAMIRSAVAEADLEAGEVPGERRRKAGFRAAAITLCVLAGVLYFGRQWWSAEAVNYGRTVFKPMSMSAQVDRQSLLLRITDPGWIGSDLTRFGSLPAARSVDDLVPDHGHLMHLYMLRTPGFDVVLHLHPDQVKAGEFTLLLPAVPAGDYKLYADVVHQNGLPETLVSQVHIDTAGARPVSGDDAFAIAQPWTTAPLDRTAFDLPDGFRMEWVRPAGQLHARRPDSFRYRLVDAKGNAPKDMALYMGMVGHAAFLKPDGSVFAHIHPNGTVTMAAYMQANGLVDHSAMHHMEMGTIANEVTFPYGFPSPGRYRIVVQMKHGETVETGVFDTVAEQ